MPIEDGLARGLKGLTTYALALSAVAEGTQDADELVKRFKRIFLEYAALSSRYLALVKQIPKLRLTAHELSERYVSLDNAFDELAARASALRGDLEKHLIRSERHD